MSNSNPYEDFSRNRGWQGEQPSQSGQPGSDQSIPPTQYAPSDVYSSSPQYQQPYQQGYVLPAPAYPPSSQYQQGYAPPSPYSPYAAPGNPPDQGAGLALAGLILGIVSIITALIPICGMPFSIVGIVLSALGRRSVSRHTMATIGLILSIVALVLALIIAVLSFSYQYRYR